LPLFGAVFVVSRLGPNQLTVRKIESLGDGVWGDGGNLWITITGKRRAWSFRYKSPTTGKNREMGLGSCREVSLAEARQAASEARKLLRASVDPLEERRAREAEAERGRAKALTFAMVAEQYIKEQTPGWKDSRRAAVWTSSLERLAYPTLGDKPVAAIDTDDVLAVVRPIWTTINETADRVRGRIERILDYARSHGWREGENAARWRGHLANILPKPSAVSKVEHRPAVPWQDIRRVMTALGAAEGLGAKATRFACLTATRSGEVRGATWAEVDLKKKVWVLPPERTKMRKEHRVPLSAAALAVLAEVNPLAAGRDSYLFPGGRAARPLSDVALSKALHQAAGTKEVTVHGFRSTFRDWVAEATEYPREVAEMALAHAISSQVEAAYRRGDLFEKRTAMMEEWGQVATAAATAQRAAAE